MNDTRTTNKLLQSSLNLQSKTNLTNSLLLSTSSIQKKLQLTNKVLLTDERKKKSDLDEVLEIKKPKINLKSNILTNQSALLVTTNITPKSTLPITTTTTITKTNSHLLQTRSHLLPSSNRSLKLTNTLLNSINKVQTKPNENILNVVNETFEPKILTITTANANNLFNDITNTVEYHELVKNINSEYKNFDEETKRIDDNFIDFIDPFSSERKISGDTSLINAKSTLVNLVSSSLLRAPKFKDPKDPTRLSIIEIASRIIPYDGEFILKLALYTRKELNIRVTANFLLSLSAFHDECRKYMSRYFSKSIVLPSDWIDVAEQYQVFFDKRIKYGSLPSALRKCMIQKFVDFDEYQLAKYNKEKSKAKTKTANDTKYVRAKVTADDGVTEETEEKYIKSLSNDGLKFNDLITVELFINENCKSFKIDLVAKEEAPLDIKPAKFSRKNKPIPVPKTQQQFEERVALRLIIDFSRDYIVKKCYLKKLWSRPEVKFNSAEPTLSFENRPTRVTVTIGVNANEFTITINDKLISTHKHSLHNIEMFKINCLRVSGVNIKMMKLNVESRELIHQMESEENEEELQQRTFTLKQLIRQLHISQPVQYVLCLLGKRYPASYDEFMRLGLSGEYDSLKANKRMKLAIPETWETQISMKGNHAYVWEQLIDNKKLPYMAMLRNLRNMIKAGIDEKHHQWVIKKLQDEGAVINSKQFPISFFSAYEVLDDLEKEFNEYISWCENGRIEEVEVATDNRNRKNGKTGKKANKYKDMAYDCDILKRYKKALDNALKVATTYNVSPIKGKTLLFVNLGPSMNMECKTARIGKSSRSVCDIAILLGLMFKYSCEYSKLMFYTNSKSPSLEMELEEGTILDNMKSVLEIRNLNKFSQNTQTVEDCLQQLITNRIQYDNIVIISENLMSYENDKEFFNKFLKKYRVCVNKSLLFVNVDLGATNVGLSLENTCFQHPNDIIISGYSDSILRFVAERGNQGQLLHIEHIDKSYDLPVLNKNEVETKTQDDSNLNLFIEKPLSIFTNSPKWRTTKVFISSTFKDMHSERDILSRVVFPMLREKLNQRFINVHEIDMRWGINESQVIENRTLDICLNQILDCEFFIGMLGDRYGHVAESYVISENSKLNWLQNYPSGASITELEIECAAFKKQSIPLSLEKTFFYFRNNSFLSDVPEDIQNHFTSEDNDAKRKLEKLKRKIQSHSFEVYDGYKCKWFGMDATGRALLTDLNEFAERVFNNLLNAIKNAYPYDQAVSKLDEISNETNMHEMYVNSCAEHFIGRQKLLNQCNKLVNDQMLAFNYKSNNAHIMLIDGEAGSGKTKFLSRFVQMINEQTSHRFVHFIGACLSSEYVIKFMKRFEIEMNRSYNLNISEDTINETNDLRYHKACFESVLNKLCDLIQDKLFIIVDSVDQFLDNNGNMDDSLSWLPDKIPANVTFILTARNTSRIAEILNKKLSNSKKDKIESFHYDRVTIAELEILEKSSLIRDKLSIHHKSLNENGFNNQMKFITGKRDAFNPLYLALACEELRLHNNFDTLTQKLKDIPQRLTALIPYVLDRLENDFGESYVSSAFLFLYCAKDDLEEFELKKMLNLYLILKHENYLDKLNLMSSLSELKSIRNLLNTGVIDNTEVKFLSFIHSISATFLKERPEGSYSLSIRSHSAIETSIRNKYAKSTNFIETSHRVMAIYYWLEIDKKFDFDWSTSKNPRAFSYLPYHLVLSNFSNDLIKILCDLRFLAFKCSFGLVAQLLDDFDLHANSKTKNVLLSSSLIAKANSKLNSTVWKGLESKRFLDYKSFITTNYHILSTCPSLIFQQALNQPKDTAPFDDLKNIMANKSVSLMFEFLDNQKQFQINNTPMRINDFNNSVTSVAISQSGHYLAVGTEDCEIKLYILSTAKLVKKLHGHSGKINQLCFVGVDTLCSTSSDGLASLWNVSGGYRIRILNKHNDHTVSGCSADPNGKQLLTVGWDCSIRIWNAQDGNYLGEMRGHGRPINCIAYHPEGDLIATGCWDSCVRIFNVFNKQRKAVLRGHLSSVRSISYSKNGTYIASSSIDGEVFLWNSLNGTQVGILKGHTLPVNCLRYSEVGNLLFTCSSDKKVKVWSGSFGKMIKVIKDEQVRITSVCFNQKNGKTFAVGYQLGEIRIYDLEGNCLDKFNLHKSTIIRLKYTHDGQYLVSTSENGLVYVTEIKHDTHKLITTLKGSSYSVNALSLNKYDVIVTGSEDCVLRVYANAFQDEDIFDAQTSSEACAPKFTYGNHSSPITACSFNVDGTRLVSTSKNATIIIWRCSIQTSELTINTQINSAHLDWITDCEWSNSADFIITASNDFNLKIWDANTGEERNKLVGHTASISKCVYQYGCAISSCADGTLKVWSHKGHEISTLHGHQSRVNCCDMFVTLKSSIKDSIDDNDDEKMETDENTDWAEQVDEADRQKWVQKHDSTKLNKKTHTVDQLFLVSVSDDHTIRLWKPMETDSLLDLDGHNDKIETLAIGKNNILCTGSADKSVMAWNLDNFVSKVSSGKIIENQDNIRDSHRSEIVSICISERHNLIFSVSINGLVIVWKFNVESRDFSDLKSVRQIQAHETSCNKLIILGETKNGLEFATCSDDRTTKTWLLEINDTGLVNIKMNKVMRESYPVKYIEKYNNLIVNVSMSNPIVQICYYEINKNYTKLSKAGCRLFNFTSFFHDIKIYEKNLYMTDISQKVVCLDLEKSLKSLSTHSNESPSEHIKIYKSYSNDSTWFTSLIKCSDSKLKVTDWTGCLYSTENETSQKFDFIKKIHNGSITHIKQYKINNVNRLITTSHDCTVKIWTEDFERQLGQFNFNYGITSILVVNNIDNFINIICGDQMGTIQVLRWYDKN